MVVGPSLVFAALALAWLTLQLPPAVLVAPPTTGDACGTADRCALRLEVTIQNYSLALGGSLAANLVLALAVGIQCCLVRRPAAASRRTVVDERSRPEGLEPAARYLVDTDSYRPPVPRRR